MFTNDQMLRRLHAANPNSLGQRFGRQQLRQRFSALNAPPPPVTNPVAQTTATTGPVTSSGGGPSLGSVSTPTHSNALQQQQQQQAPPQWKEQGFSSRTAFAKDRAMNQSGALMEAGLLDAGTGQFTTAGNDLVSALSRNPYEGMNWQQAGFKSRSAFAQARAQNRAGNLMNAGLMDQNTGKLNQLGMGINSRLKRPLY